MMMEIELIEARRQIERLQLMCDVLRAERNSSRAQVDNLVMQLSSVHALLYPPAIKLQDGRTMVFRPKDPNPHEVLQALSDRIRSIPQNIADAFKPEAMRGNDEVLSDDSAKWRPKQEAQMDIETMTDPHLCGDRFERTGWP